MRHQPPVLAHVVGNVFQVRGVGHGRVQVQEEDGQRVVGRVPRGVHDARLREQGLDKADVQEVVRPLVGDLRRTLAHQR